jgi:hypothetical protein
LRYVQDTQIYQLFKRIFKKGKKGERERERERERGKKW